MLICHKKHKQTNQQTNKDATYRNGEKNICIYV